MKLLDTYYLNDLHMLVVRTLYKRESFKLYPKDIGLNKVINNYEITVRLINKGICKPIRGNEHEAYTIQRICKYLS